MTTSSPEDTERAAADFARTLLPGDCVCLDGDLGAGKTAFVRGAASVLCPGVRTQSPTYTIMNRYKGKCPVLHFDMYRVEDEDSLYSTGYFDVIESDAVIFIEWSKNILPYLPEHRYVISIVKDGESTRTIKCERL